MNEVDAGRDRATPASGGGRGEIVGGVRKQGKGEEDNIFDTEQERDTDHRRSGGGGRVLGTRRRVHHAFVDMKESEEEAADEPPVSIPASAPGRGRRVRRRMISQ